MSLRAGSAARLAAEFVVIVLGVLVALGADQWVANRADRATEHEYLERLLDDVVADRAENAFIVEMHGMSLEAADSLLVWMRADRIDDIPEARLLVTFGYAAEQREPDYSRSAYQELIASGRIGLIRSPEVRAALAAYDRTINEYRGAWVGRVRGAFHDFRSRNFHPRTQRTFIDDCFDRRMVSDCEVDVTFLDVARLRAGLGDPVRVGELLASMNYQATVGRVIQLSIDPIAARLEAALRTELGA